MPTILWPRLGRVRWFLSAFMLLWILLLWAALREEPSRRWFAQIYLLVFPFTLGSTLVNTHVISGGVFAICRNLHVRRIPLASAELTRKGNRLRLRWPSGRLHNADSFNLPASFADALEAAAEAARTAEPGSQPRTEAESATALTIGYPIIKGGWPFPLVLLTVLGLVSLGIWLNQPLLLLPLVLLHFVSDRYLATPLLLLSGEALWLLKPGEEPHPIPFTTIQGVTSATRVNSITTGDPLYPSIRLHSAHSGELLRHLRRRLQGEPAPRFTVATTEEQPQTGPHCSLCGRPLGGAPGSTQICDTCTARTRYEATAQGHGLATKEAKPM